MDMDFALCCLLVRSQLPRIRFLFVGTRSRSTLPSDGLSRFRPCASLVLHLHQVAQGTFTPRLPGMPGTQPCAFGAPLRGGGLDHDALAERSASMPSTADSIPRSLTQFALLATVSVRSSPGF